MIISFHNYRNKTRVTTAERIALKEYLEAIQNNEGYEDKRVVQLAMRAQAKTALHSIFDIAQERAKDINGAKIILSASGSAGTKLALSRCNPVDIVRGTFIPVIEYKLENVNTYRRYYSFVTEINKLIGAEGITYVTVFETGWNL